ncbi:unnamed protein product, partial [Adineta steineri]
STETNSEVEEPFSDADNIDKIDCFKLPSTETMNVSIIKLPRVTASAPIDQGIQASKSHCSTSQTLLTNDKALLKFKQNNSTTINQRKSMPLNYKDTSRISHEFFSSAKVNNTSAVRIVKIKNLKLSSLVSNDPTIGIDK